jgi:hypothetical protein
VGAHLGPRGRNVHGENRRVILRALLAVTSVVWKVVAVFFVTLLVLFAIGWLVDEVVDPAEQEITTVES